MFLHVFESFLGVRREKKAAGYVREKAKERERERGERERERGERERGRKSKRVKSGWKPHPEYK